MGVERLLKVMNLAIEHGAIEAQRVPQLKLELEEFQNKLQVCLPQVIC
jgi:hypothetical protein